ncbi:MAG: reverse transcriptase domain-containing protein [Verrucomicrobiota bacterium]|nr:reverse transcriptase domain-containing protein [Verrucomicrobiota bacterium]
MKRTGNLFEKIVDLDNLLEAFHATQKGKADRLEVRQFREHLHSNIDRIRSELLSGTFQFGDYRHFTVHDPKTRRIQSAPFPQRVVHHAMVNIVGPVLERRFIFDTYACRKDKGQHAALQRADDFARLHPCYLKMDIRKFYDSIDHGIMLNLLARRIKDRSLLELFEQLLDSYCTVPGKGLPIGNLTSQHFGNVYLDEFDHWIKETRRVRHYLRYMDDMLCFGSLDEMRALHNESEEWLYKHLALHLNHHGEINRCSKGLPFVGFVIHTQGIRLSQRSEHRFRTKFRNVEKVFSRGLICEPELQSRATSLVAAVSHGRTQGLRRHLASTSRLSGCVYGFEPREMRRQLEQQRQELPCRQPQQEQPDEHEQQHRVRFRLARQYRGRDSG